MIADWTLFLFVLLLSCTGGVSVLLHRRFDAVGGVVLGYSYFIGGPVLQLLLFGQIDDFDLAIDPVRLGSSLPLATYLLLTAGVTLCFLKFPRNDKIGGLAGSFDAPAQLSVYVTLHLVAYGALAVTLFLMSGKMRGGHWMEANNEMYASGFLPTIVGNFYNVLRVTLPGVVAFAFLRKVRSFRSSISTLIVFAVFEVIVSSNRIVLLFTLMAIALILWTHNKKLLIILVVLAPIVAQFNAVFPAVRGLMWSQGLSYAQTSDSFRVAIDSAKEPMPERGSKLVGSAFESANIMVLQYVMDTYGRSKPLLHGETMLIKPATLFLPKSIFPAKPEGFNTRVGFDITGNNILALNTTLAGEAFGNFGWLGPAFFGLVAVLFFTASRLLGGRLVEYQLFFVAFAAWRFEFAFLAIGVFVLFWFYVLSASCVKSMVRLQSAKVCP